MPEDTRPLPKRFPGQYCMRSTLWVPDKEDPSKHSFKLGFEGGLHPAVGKVIMAIQAHQSRLTPEMVAQLTAMTEALTGK